MRIFLLLTLAIVLPGLALGSEDTTPPELKSLRFTPASIDTSAGAAEVTLTFSVTDDASGATYFEATFVDALGVARQSASAKFAPTVAATNSIKVAFPRFSNAGAWTLAHVFLSDAAGNSLNLDADGLNSRGLPTRLEVKSVRDTVSPKLTSLEFSPAQIDTSAGPADVNVNYSATDDLSGVTYIELSFVSPSGATRRNGSARFEPAQSVSKSLTVTFPRLSDAGQWTLSAVLLSDAAGNTQILDAEGIVRAGFKPNLEVKSMSDTTPPSLTGLRFAPEAIDTSGGPAMVKVDFTATDDLAGVSYAELSFTSPSGKVKQGGSVRLNPAKSVSSSFAVPFPPHSEAGTWTLTAVYLSDAAGNPLLLDAEAVLRLGLQTALEVKSTSDTTPPNLTALRFSPDAIDTSRGAAEVKVEFTATDNLSGVKSIEVVFVSPSGQVRQRAAAAFSPAKELTGSVTAIFPQSSEPGNWKVGSVLVADAAGNTLNLDADALSYKVGKSLQVR
jgi:hypothetical protein